MDLKKIINFIKPLKTILNSEVENVVFKSIDNVEFDSSSIAWCSDKNHQILKKIKSGTVILSELGLVFCQENNLSSFNKLIVSNPKKVFVSLIKKFLVKKLEFGVIADSAIIHPTTIFNANMVNISHNVIIEENVVVGENVVIGPNTVIKEGTIIHNNIKIGSNNTIGGIGFGYEQNEEGEYEIIPHLGNVIIEDFVEIGSNTCIDRAVLGSTRLSRNVKVDNLVHIAHGVQVGENSLIIANAMVAGSVKIGKNVWVAPSSSIRQKLSIGDDSIVGMGSVVVKKVEAGDIVAGVPAKKMN